MKYTARPLLAPGKFAVFSGSKYFANTVSTDLQKAQIDALVMSAHWHQEQMDRIHRKLEKFPGFINQQDPKGYLA